MGRAGGAVAVPVPGVILGRRPTRVTRPTRPGQPAGQVPHQAAHLGPQAHEGGQFLDSDLVPRRGQVNAQVGADLGRARPPRFTRIDYTLGVISG